MRVKYRSAARREELFHARMLLRMIGVLVSPLVDTVCVATGVVIHALDDSELPLCVDLLHVRRVRLALRCSAALRRGVH